MSEEVVQRLIDKLNALSDRLEAIKQGLRQVIGIIPGWPVPWQSDPGTWTTRDLFVDSMTESNVNAYADAVTAYQGMGDNG